MHNAQGITPLALQCSRKLLTSATFSLIRAEWASHDMRRGFIFVTGKCVQQITSIPPMMRRIRTTPVHDKVNFMECICKIEPTTMQANKRNYIAAGAVQKKSHSKQTS